MVLKALGPFSALGALVVVGLVWYYFSPEYTNVGYKPSQPIEYSHKLHAGDLGMDCRYCHTSVETTAFAGVPPVQTCMNCHKLILTESEKLKALYESWDSGKPIAWTRVHDLADYVYFDHSAHLNAGVGCESCHGNITQMDVVKQVHSLSMAWCLDCHRNPDKHLRPKSKVTEMGWVPPANQLEMAQKFKKERNLKPSSDCTVCHR